MRRSVDETISLWTNGVACPISVDDKKIINFIPLQMAKNALVNRTKNPSVPIFCPKLTKFINFEVETWIGVSNTLKTILNFSSIFKLKFKDLLLTKTCISLDCSHTNLHIVIEVNTDINRDVFYNCAKFEGNRKSFIPYQLYKI